ncbi:MAG: SDR family NAD(P)-dependent oxidoreductase [Acidobacteriota bacterium]|nr:MAG: SDR family NAD(P)-dependent oxidoreductase [Acidobacteriota bacterium]
MNIDQSTVAIITGAGSGIGRALALNLARRGASLALADIKTEALDETARLIGYAQAPVTTHCLDVSDRERYAEFAAEVMARGPNLLINNAGVALAGTAEEISLDDIEWLMGINFWGVVYGVKYFLPELKRQNRAHIVNISSVFGLIAPPGQIAYVASKFAVRGFTETLRHELAGSNVSVSVVHPGGVATNIANHARIGKSADTSSLDRERETFNKVARTPPDRAAERIIRGIESEEQRILVGPDAVIIDRIQRWVPVKYWSILGKLLEMRNGR